MVFKRIWKGRKELGRNYFCGQILLREGRLSGCWRTVTSEYDTESQALTALSDYDKYKDE